VEKDEVEEREEGRNKDKTNGINRKGLEEVRMRLRDKVYEGGEKIESRFLYIAMYAATFFPDKVRQTAISSLPSAVTIPQKEKDI
jgi:hypothetical protein